MGVDLRHTYASKGQRGVEVLDGADLRAEANGGTRIWNQTGPAMRVVAQAVEKNW